MALTQDTVLTFLLERGGKVKNSDLLSKFKEALSCSDPVEKKQNRDLFKTFVNNIAVVKVIDEVKYVVVKKKYQGFVNHISAIVPKNEFEDGLSRLDTSFCSPERTGALKNVADYSVQPVYEKNNNTYGTLNNNTLQGSDFVANNHLRNSSAPGGCCNADGERHYISSRNDSISVRKDYKTRKTGAVFAIVAVKSPPNSPSEGEHLHTSGQTPQQQHHLQAIRINSPDVLLNRSEDTVQSKVTGRNKCEWDTSPEVKRRQLESKFPDLPQEKGSNRPSKPINEPKYSEGVPLELVEHEWLVKSAAGHWDQVYGLLLQDAQLADRRDFISGFSALHWAAKDGNVDMVRKLIDVPRDRYHDVDVNARAHAGYTPLHIAAIHGRDAVVALLVREYHACIGVRDNSGKKPYHYLPEGAKQATRELLGDPRACQPPEAPCEGAEEGQGLAELPRGFHTLSKLFHPHSGGPRKKHRHGHRHRPSFHFHHSSEEASGDERREHHLSRRLSEMFH